MILGVCVCSALFTRLFFEKRDDCSKNIKLFSRIYISPSMRGAPYLPIYKFQLEFQISFIACTFLVYIADLFIENGSTAIVPSTLPLHLYLNSRWLRLVSPRQPVNTMKTRRFGGRRTRVNFIFVGHSSTAVWRTSILFFDFTIIFQIAITPFFFCFFFWICSFFPSSTV